MTAPEHGSLGDCPQARSLPQNWTKPQATAIIRQRVGPSQSCCRCCSSCCRRCRSVVNAAATAVIFMSLLCCRCCGSVIVAVVVVDLIWYVIDRSEHAYCLLHCSNRM